jgi:WD40 repeat protein
VNRATFSPDGKWVVTASDDNTAQVWDAATGKTVSPALKHEVSIKHAAFSPDSKRVVTASNDDTARIWDAATGRPLTSPLKHNKSVEHTIFSPDGKRVITASADYTARVWNAVTGQAISPSLNHDSWVERATFSPDGKRVVTVSSDNTARVWDAATGRPLTPPLKHESIVRRAMFSPDGKRVVTASDDNTARLWDTESGQELKRVTIAPPADGPRAAAEAAAPEPPKQEAKKENSLFNEQDLTGWDGLPGYWQVKNGCIVGEPPPGRKAHTFLCSKKTYRDFDLKFRVKREGGIGNSGLQFRSRIKDRALFTVVGPQCEIDDLNFTLPPGSLVTEPNGNPLKVKPSAAALEALAKVYKNDAFNDFHIRCIGKHVTIRVNNVTTVDDNFPSLPDEGIIAWQFHGTRPPRSVTFRIVEFTDLSASASADGFVPLFNGKDKTEWRTHPTQPGDWRIVKGTNGDVLTGSGTMKLKQGSHLFSERGDYKDFHLRVQARINNGGNSGVYFRTQFGPGFPKGYEAQINSTHGDPIKTGSLYPSFNAKLTKEQRDKLIVYAMLVRPDEWFTLEVIAQGNHIVIKVNDKPTVDFVDESNAYTKGHIALQQHDPQTVCEFRRIEIKELK